MRTTTVTAAIAAFAAVCLFGCEDATNFVQPPGGGGGSGGSGGGGGVGAEGGEGSCPNDRQCGLGDCCADEEECVNNYLCMPLCANERCGENHCNRFANQVHNGIGPERVTAVKSQWRAYSEPPPPIARLADFSGANGNHPQRPPKSLVSEIRSTRPKTIRGNRCHPTIKLCPPQLQPNTMHCQRSSPLA